MSITQQNELLAGSLRGQFLISMPSLQDPHFNHSVTYICDHSDEGAMGLVLNHPFNDITLGDIFQQVGLEDEAGRGDEPVFAGGPVQRERGFVLHPAGFVGESTLKVTDEVSLSTSRDVLASMAAGLGPQQTLVALGYAGWSPGQLEDEISANSWITLPGDSALLFNTPAHQRWSAAAERLGFDLNLLSSAAGHA